MAPPLAPAVSVRDLADSLDPAVDERLVLLGPVFGQALGVQPGAMHALGAEMMLRPEPRRIVERADGQIHILAVGKGEAERRSAFAAIRPPRDRRGGIPVGLALPGDVGLLHVLE